jgi:hypothetical protein
VLDDDAVVARWGRGQRAGEANGFLGVPAEEFGGVGDLGASIGECLAVLERNEEGEVVETLRQELERPAQRLSPFPWSHACPGVLSRGRARDRCDGIGVGCRTNLGDGLLGRRIDHLEGRVIGCFTPRAADEERRRQSSYQVGRHHSGFTSMPEDNACTSKRERKSLSLYPRPIAAWIS